MMANQIAKNLAIQGEERAITGTANHISKFWDPRMRTAIAAHVSTGGRGLHPLAKKAIEVAAGHTRKSVVLIESLLPINNAQVTF